MDNKIFLIDFDVTIDLAGTLFVKADTPETAQALAKSLIKSCLEKEDCYIELSVNEDDENSKFLTVREMGHSRALNITNTMALN